jgi:hypothetical protein
MNQKEKETYKRLWLQNSQVSFSRLVELHKLFTTFTIYRGAEAQKADDDYLGFNDVGIMCLLATSTVMTRHISAIQHLLSAKYPVQAMILLRALIETWFYTIMYFEEPTRAEDYFKNPTDSKNKPKYRPHEVKEIALRVVRDCPVPLSEEFATVIAEQYKIACEMVHMSNSLMYASFGVFSGEEHIPFDASSENDKYLYIAYGRILHVSSAFWITLYFSFLSEDEHPYTNQLAESITDYFCPALELVRKIDPLFDTVWNEEESE